ncbi:MAG: hypothetical protein GKR89_04185 [Candidatus Latescibacteria bacterium]|nr:hypothetical protein [Candidatus Latescibacterota bacterium]
MTFNHFNRRLHVYLGMALLPWVLMYGLSSLAFSHNRLFDKWFAVEPGWTVLLERPYDRPVPEDADLRQVGAAILADLGLEGGALGTWRPHQRRLNVYRYDFWSNVRVSYHLDEQRLVAEEHRFRWDHFLTGLHARGGYQQDSLLHDGWALVVDLVCIGFLLWSASGLYMWWLLSQTRRWGALALAAGFLAFVLFAFTL